MPKIYFVTYENFTNARGVSEYLKHTRNSLRGSYDLVTICPGQSRQTLEKDGATWEILPTSKNSFLKIIGFQYQVKKFILEQSDSAESIIDFQETCGFLALLSQKFKNKVCQTVVTYHHSHAEELKVAWRMWRYQPLAVLKQIFMLLSSFEQKKSIKWARWVITVTEKAKIEVLAFGQKSKKVFVVPNSFSGSGIIPIANLSSLSRKYIYLGGFDARKGIDLALKAFLKIKGPEDTFDLIGTGPLMPWAKKFVQKNNLAKQVIFHNYVDRVKKDELMQSAETFVFPSLCEGFGIVILEAMQQGLQIVASDLAVFRAEFGESLVYFKAGDVVDLAKAMQGQFQVDLDQYQQILEKYSFKNFNLACQAAFNNISHER